MKKLTLIRHAKSSWEHNVIDHQRPLNNSGIEAAQKISKALKNSLLNIDLLLCSDALRTQQTAAIFIENTSLKQDQLKLSYDLYDFEGRNLIHVIKNCDNSVDSLMVFGHNNALTAFVNMYGNKAINNVPTCGVVTISFDIDNWMNLKKGKTVFTLFPKEL